jgi:phage virion morphogenesis protein
MITITVNDREVRELLAGLFARATDFTPAMESIGAELETRIRARFETQADPLGHKWADWAPSTKKSYPGPGTKSDDGPGHGRILERYGKMLESISWQAGATSVRVGFGQLYAQYHEYGAKWMPRRGILFANPEAKTLAPGDQRYVLDVIEQHILAA